MTKTSLYVVRHGKTMFNTLERVQGWCDTPLTAFGQKEIRHAGLGLADVPFEEAYSSDSGRAIETARLILGEHSDAKNIPHNVDPRIREWCFGSLEGGFDKELWGVIPRVLDFKNEEEMYSTDISFEEIANAIYQADTANWAETYDQLRNRVWSGFEDIAHKREKAGGGNVLIVSHGLTISFLLNLIDSKQPIRAGIRNGSVSLLEYEDGQFTIKSINDVSHIERGEVIAKEK